MKRFLAASLAIGAVTFVTVFSVRHFQNRNRVQLAASEETQEHEAPQRNLKDILAEPAAVGPFNLGGNRSPVCQEFWRQAAQTRFANWTTEVNEIGWKRPEECGEEEPSILSRLARGVQVACMKRPSDRRKVEQTACQQSLFNYRLKLIDLLTADQKNYLDMPLSLLLTKVLADHLGDEEGERAALPDFWARIEALGKREPDWFQARKLAVIGLYYRQTAEEDADLKAQIGERLTAELETATAMETQDPQILEIELLRQVNLGEEGTAEIEKFAMKYANFAVGQYHWAAVLCRENNRSECLSALEKTVSLRPDDLRFRETLDRVRGTEKVTDPALFSLEPDFNVLAW